MIELRDLSVAQGQFAISAVNLTVPAGAHAVLMGPTGCGKTTLLETVAGLRRPSRGLVLLHGVDVTALPPASRGLGYVTQDGAVFRTMTVRENLAFGLTVRGAPGAGRVDELAARLGLTAILGRRAVNLSGGEAQRVAFGRALAFRPGVLLLDEPFNAVDDATREQLLALLRSEQASRPLTVLHVTHDRGEAPGADAVVPMASLLRGVT